MWTCRNLRSRPLQKGWNNRTHLPWSSILLACTWDGLIKLSQRTDFSVSFWVVLGGDFDRLESHTFRPSRHWWFDWLLNVAMFVDLSNLVDAEMATKVTWHLQTPQLLYFKHVATQRPWWQDSCDQWWSHQHKSGWFQVRNVLRMTGIDWPFLGPLESIAIQILGRHDHTTDSFTSLHRRQLTYSTSLLQRVQIIVAGINKYNTYTHKHIHTTTTYCSIWPWTYLCVSCDLIGTPSKSMVSTPIFYPRNFVPSQTLAQFCATHSASAFLNLWRTRRMLVQCNDIFFSSGRKCKWTHRPIKHYQTVDAKHNFFKVCRR